MLPIRILTTLGCALLCALGCANPRRAGAVDELSKSLGAPGEPELRAPNPESALASDETRSAVAPEEAPALLEARRILGARLVSASDGELGRTTDLELESRSASLVGLLVETRTGARARFDFQELDLELAGQEILLRLRAEPRPRPCLAIDPTRLFAGRELERLEGKVTALGVELDERGVAQCTLKLNDPGNRYHRAWIAPLAWLERSGGAPRRDEPVELRGVFTHDERGKLFVASSIASAGRPPIRLREASGEPTWPTLEPELLLLGRDLLDARLELPGLESAPIAEALLDWRKAVLVEVRVDAQGGQRAYAFGALEPSEGGWRPRADAPR